MKEKEFNRQLVKRYLSNTATQEEVEAFLHLSGSGKLDDIIAEHLEQALDTKHHSQVMLKPKRKLIASIWGRIAATILVIMAASIYFYINKEVKTEPREVPKTIVQGDKLDIRPGDNKAILTLENGEEIILDGSPKGIIAKQTRSVVNVPDTGMIAYSLREDGTNTGSLTYNAITTPRGGHYKVILPDGSKVWLNADSYLKYPTFFSGEQRRVELKGEGYFEVAHDAAKPFVVSTGSHTVTVLGTHFNINAYTEEKIIRTTLLEGKVKVGDISSGSTAMLQPGEQSVCGKSISVVKADIEEAVAWKNGYFLFINENIESVMRKVSRWYNVDIVYEDDVSKKAIWGSVSKFKNVSEILNVLELTGAVRFKIEEDRIVVKKAK